MSGKARVYAGALCIAASFSGSIYFLPAAAAGGLLLSYREFAELRKAGFYLIIILFAALPGLILPGREGISMALSILLRVIAVYGGFLSIVSNLNFTRLNHLLLPVLGRDISRSLSLSMNLFPSMRNDLASGWAVLSLNSRRRVPLTALPATAVRCALRNASEMCLRLKVREMSLPETVLITGETDSGKTRRLLRYAREEKKKRRVMGFAAEGVYENSIKTGFDARDLSSGETRPLSRAGWPPGKGERAGRFRLSSETADWVSSLFEDIPEGSALFIDESGPLELSGGGFAPLIEKAARSKAAIIYITSRRSCARKTAAKFFPNHRVRRVKA